MLAALVGPAPPAASGGHAATPHNPAAWLCRPGCPCQPRPGSWMQATGRGQWQGGCPEFPYGKGRPTGSACSGPLRAQRASCGRSRLVPPAGVPLAAASCASRRPCDQVVAGRTGHQNLQLTQFSTGCRCLAGQSPAGCWAPGCAMAGPASAAHARRPRPLRPLRHRHHRALDHRNPYASCRPAPILEAPANKRPRRSAKEKTVNP